jgi:hypothetical protein
METVATLKANLHQVVRTRIRDDDPTGRPRPSVQVLGTVADDELLEHGAIVEALERIMVRSEAALGVPSTEERTRKGGPSIRRRLHRAINAVNLEEEFDLDERVDLEGEVHLLWQDIAVMFSDFIQVSDEEHEVMYGFLDFASAEVPLIALGPQDIDTLGRRLDDAGFKVCGLSRALYGLGMQGLVKHESDGYILTAAGVEYIRCRRPMNKQMAGDPDPDEEPPF